MDVEAVLEAILFSSDEPVPVGRLAAALGISEHEVYAACEILDGRYAGRGVSLDRVAGGLMLVTRPEVAQYIEKALLWKVPVSLSKGAMETLAVVAYRQPVTRQDIESARGVNPEASIDTLLEKGLIKEVGRKKSLGRPKLYGTTEEFLKKASLDSISDLPALRGAEDEGEGLDSATEGPVRLPFDDDRGCPSA